MNYLINPFIPTVAIWPHFSILLWLTPDDFTCRGEAPRLGMNGSMTEDILRLIAEILIFLVSIGRQWQGKGKTAEGTLKTHLSFRCTESRLSFQNNAG